MPVGTTPLALLIETERGARPLAQIARQAGMSYGALRYYRNLGRWDGDHVPKPEVLERIARGLGVPLVRVQQAAIDSVEARAGTKKRETSATAEQQEIMHAVERLPPRLQRFTADIVQRISDEFTPGEGP